MSLLSRAFAAASALLRDTPPSPQAESTPRPAPQGPLAQDHASARVQGEAKARAHGEALASGRTFNLSEGWSNEQTGMGQAETDDAVSTIYVGRRRLTDQELRWIFRQTLAARIITEPILDMLALGEQEGARAWNYRPARGSTATQEATATAYAQALELALDEMPVILDSGRQVIGYTRALADARTWADVFGGALIVLDFDDAAPLSRPPQRPRRILGARVYSRPRVWPQSYYGQGYGVLAGRIASYIIDGGVEVHESRVQRLDGLPLDHESAMNNQWWGESRIEQFYEQLRRLGMGRAASSNTLKDLATAIYSLKNLKALTSAQGIAQLTQLWGARHMLKGRYRAIILDADGEKAEFRSPNLAGVQDILQIHQGDLCAASGFPEERLFGRASKGLNSNSDGLTHYYDRIRARRTEEVLPLALSIAQAMMACSQGPTGGKVVPLSVQFPPIATPSPKDQAETDYKQAQTDSIYIEKGVATVEQVQDRTRARYGG